jgi:hypothetical protein
MYMILIFLNGHKLDTVVHIRKPGTQEAEAGGLLA